jgi:hypothetical protein
MMRSAGRMDLASVSEEKLMQNFSMNAVILAIVLALAAGTADAAGRRHGGASAAPQQTTTADQLNAESLQRAQQGMNSPTPGPDTTSNLNRMSDQDAARGRAMPQPPMPYR